MSTLYSLDDAVDLLDLSIQEILPKMTNLDENDPVLGLYHKETTADYYEKDSGLSGFGEAARLTDGAVLTSETPVQTFDKTYTQTFHGKLATFTKQSWMFGIDRRRLTAVVEDLMRSVHRKRNRILTEYLENSIGATTSYTVTDDSGSYTKSVVGGDGVAHINSAHTREDGGSAWSNVVSDGSTSNMDFAPDAIEAAHRTASLVRDPKGNLMDVRLDKFVFRKGSSAAFDAHEIRGALSKGYAPNSAENNGAPYGSFDIVELPYLSTDAEAYWWACDSRLNGMLHGLQLRVSEEPTLDAPEVDYKTKSIMVSSIAGFDYGHNDSRNWVGSDGTNT